MSCLDRNTCEETFRRLDTFLDRELDEADATAVREHLEACEACAAAFDFEESLIADIRSKLNQVDIPTDLRERVFAVLEQARGQKDEAATMDGA